MKRPESVAIAVRNRKNLLCLLRQDVPDYGTSYLIEPAVVQVRWFSSKKFHCRGEYPLHWSNRQDDRFSLAVEENPSISSRIFATAVTFNYTGMRIDRSIIWFAIIGSKALHGHSVAPFLPDVGNEENLTGRRRENLSDGQFLASFRFRSRETSAVEPETGNTVG
jgi:hypothetical protein